MLMLRMSDSEYTFVQNWLAGSLWGADWPNIRILSTGLLILLVLYFYKSRTLNVLCSGASDRHRPGVGVSRQSVLLLGAAVAMSSLSCAVGGGFQFCGPCLSPSGPSPDRLQLPAAASCGGTYRRRADDLFGYYIPYTSVAG